MRIATCGRRAIVVAAIACTPILLAGCGRTEQYDMGQRIDMGPYTFEVAGAKKGSTQHSDRTVIATIELLLRLVRDDTAPYTTDFAHSFRTRMQLVDATGNTFRVSPRTNVRDYKVDLHGEVSPIGSYFPTTTEVYRGGRKRADSYRASVELNPEYVGLDRGMKVMHREGVGTAVTDFKLIIDNPDRQGEQPGRAEIPLR